MNGAACTCSFEEHNAIKADPARWAEQTLIGYQRDEHGVPELELRNCNQGGTMAIPVAPLQVAA